MKKYKVVRRFFAPIGAVLGTASVALAEPTLTIPSISTAYVFDAATAVFALLAIVVSVLWGLAIFKKR
jgi:hypothetical protein